MLLSTCARLLFHPQLSRIPATMELCTMATAAMNRVALLRLPVSAFTVSKEQRRTIKRNTPTIARHYREYGALPDEYTTKPLRIPLLGGWGYDEIRRQMPKRLNKRSGGGINFDWFMLDLHWWGPTQAGKYYEEKCLEVRRDPNRTPYIALMAGSYGKRWILAVEGLKAGHVMKTSRHIPQYPIIPRFGDAYPLGALPDGTKVCMISQYPHTQGGYCVTAGTSGTIMRRENERIIIQMPSKYELSFQPGCMAVVGSMSRSEHKDLHWGSMNMARRFGFRQRSGLYKKKDISRMQKFRSPPKPLNQDFGRYNRHVYFERLHFTLSPNDCTGVYQYHRSDMLTDVGYRLPMHSGHSPESAEAFIDPHKGQTPPWKGVATHRSSE